MIDNQDLALIIKHQELAEILEILYKLPPSTPLSAARPILMTRKRELDQKLARAGKRKYTRRVKQS